MKYLLAAVLSVALSGCSFLVPTKPPKFPDAPAELSEKLPGLTPLDPSKRTPKDLLDNAALNYGVCYRYIERSHAWQYWYNEQRRLWDTLK